MLKRSEEAKFMPGVWVFPGGSRRRGRRRRGSRPAAPARCASWPRRPGSSCPPTRSWSPSRRWITPEVIATRFDAWFFLALAPAHTPPKPDGVETVEARWFEPAAALEAARGGRARPRLPDLRPSSAGWPSSRTSDEALAAYRERTVEPILPR